MEAKDLLLGELIHVKADKQRVGFIERIFDDGLLIVRWCDSGWVGTIGAELVEPHMEHEWP